jgi:adenine-specific DNA methylase
MEAPALNLFPKRLIEVDLPIKRISAHARREKSIRHGHISTLHIWWARRPLAACRAVICASLWPDPADPNCPKAFRDAALKQMTAFAKATQSNKWGAEICDNGSWQRYMRLAHGAEIDPTNRLLLALAVDKQADSNSSLCAWRASSQDVGHTFGRQALPMVWDYAEPNIFSGATRDWSLAVEGGSGAFQCVTGISGTGSVEQASATEHPLPDDVADAVITDPPYYFSVPYSDLSDFFYVWLRRSLNAHSNRLLKDALTPKRQECVQNLTHSEVAHLQKDRAFYERGMRDAFNQTRRITKPDGLSVVVFAHTETEAWEALVGALVEAGWCVTGSWPIDTEMSSRVLAHRQSTLASSVHLVCRPRDDADGHARGGVVGDWRDVLTELPKRMRVWMGRLSSEGVVGADVIFACLGPALEIFSRYSRVEKASGEQVLLKEYLTYVWGAVAQEALAQIFKDADATGFEEDARLTAIWLWTLNAGVSANGNATEETDGEVEEDSNDDAEGVPSISGKMSGYILEYDAARKIAQGLGAHLEDLTSVVEVRGDKARLLGVAERTKRLFGKDEADAPQEGKRKKKDKQMALFAPEDLGELEAAEGGWGDKSVPKLGDTTLDRVHQSMILFAAGRGEALRRFLVDDGAGHDQRFWKLANALSALYPSGMGEKRWVDGVLARKKGLGL